MPDLATLSDADLKQLIDDLQREEHEVSYRRILHGKIDILRAELVARLQRQVGAGAPSSEVDVDRLTEILAGKANAAGRGLNRTERLEPRLLPRVRLSRTLRPRTTARSAALRSCTTRGGADTTMAFDPEERGGLAARGHRHGGAGARRPLRRRPAGETSSPRSRRRRSVARPTARSSSTTSPSRVSTPFCAKNDGRFVIEDQGSLNGTFVNRRRIESAELADGDELQIGKYRLTFLQK